MAGGWSCRRCRVWGGYFTILADGVDSVVDLSGVTTEDTTNSIVSVEAKNQGQVWLPQLADGGTVDLTMRSGGMVPATQWQRLHSITLDGVSTNFPALTNIDYMSFYASGGSVLSVPAARGYANPACGYLATFQASGAGSRIMLAGLTNAVSLLLNCGGFWLYVTALNGGRVELPAVKAISQGYLSITADGRGSVVDLSSLSGFVMDGQGSLTAQNGGIILLNDQPGFWRMSL